MRIVPREPEARRQPIRMSPLSFRPEAGGRSGEIWPRIDVAPCLPGRPDPRSPPPRLSFPRKIVIPGRCPAAQNKRRESRHVIASAARQSLRSSPRSSRRPRRSEDGGRPAFPVPAAGRLCSIRKGKSWAALCLVTCHLSLVTSPLPRPPAGAPFTPFSPFTPFAPFSLFTPAALPPASRLPPEPPGRREKPGRMGGRATHADSLPLGKWGLSPGAPDGVFWGLIP
jgi:hypothetical protein